MESIIKHLSQMYASELKFDFFFSEINNYVVIYNWLEVDF
jgi:hypothetical protein